ADITVGPDGQLWFTETSASKVGKFAWVEAVSQRSTDPGQGTLVPFGPGQVAPQNGNLHIELPFDLGQGGTGAFSTALVYASETVTVKPILEATLASDAQGSVPTQIQVQLTWNNGTPQSAVTFSTSGHSAGDVYLLDSQVSSAVSSTGRYPYSVDVLSSFSGGDTLDRVLSGRAAVVVNGASDPFGYGWSLKGLDSLVADSNGALWVAGIGGSRYFRALSSTTYL